MLRPDDFTAASPARHLPTELLRRYVAGELTGPQEHAVEAHTLECAQCAEVLEGLEMQPAAVTDASLAQLRQRLHARVAELAAAEPAGAVVRPLWWRPLAAAAVLLLTLGAVAWLVLRPTAQPQLATRTAPTVQQTQPVADPATDFDGAAAPVAPPVPVAPPAAPELAAVAPPTRSAERPRPALPIMDGSSAGEENRQVAAEVATADVSHAEGSLAKSSASYTPAAAPASDQMAESRRTAAPAETARRPQVAAAPASVAATAPAAAPVAGTSRTVRGRIVDNSGQPLPGATVLDAGTSTGVSTGADGRFVLVLPPGSRQVAVSSIGYTTQTRFLPAADSTLTLALAPDSRQLSEVVVVRREAPPGLPSVGPLPAGGYAAFRQYLSDSLDYPEKARELKREGTVRLQFVVEANGTLSNVKVVRRLSPECDEEAIRLLKAGPAWFSGAQNGRRTARKVEINIPFSLDKK